MSEPNLPAAPGDPGLRRHMPALAWSLVLVLGLLALGMSAFVLVAREQVDARVARAAGDSGLQVTVGEVAFSPFSGLTLRKIVVRDRRADLIDIGVAEVATDLGIWGILMGQRRPQHIVVRNVLGRLDSRPDALRDLAGRFRREPAGDSTGDARVRSALAVEVEDITLRGLEAGGVTGELRSWHGNITRDDQGGVEALARGQVVVGGQTREITIRGGLDPEQGAHIQMSSEGPVGVEVPIAGRVVAVQLTGISWRQDQKAHRIKGFGVQIGDNSARCGELAIWGLSNTRPGVDQWTKVECDESSVAIHGRTLRARQIAVNRAATPGNVVVHLDAPKGNAPDYGVDLEAGEVRLELRLRDGLAKVIKEATSDELTRTVKSLRVTEPRIRATLPDAAHMPELPGSSPAHQPDDAGLTPGFETAESDNDNREEKPGLAKDFFLPALPPLSLPGGAGTTRRLRDLRVEITGGIVDLETADQSESVHVEDLGLSIIPRGETGIEATVEAALQRSGKASGKFSITAQIDEQGVVQGASGLVAGRDLAHVISRFSDQVTVERDAGLKASFDYDLEQSPRLRHRVRGLIELTDFGFQSWRISHTRVSGLSASLDVDVVYDTDDRHLEVDLTRIDLGETQLEGALNLTAPPGGQREIALRLTMPTQDCGALARDVPPDLVPRLEGLRLEGSMSFDAQFSLDLDAPASLKLKVNGDVERCTALSLGRHIRLSALKSPQFIHHPVEPQEGKRLDISVGPGTDQWVPLSQLPRYVTSAAVVTEDRAYYFHKGVRWDLVGRAMRMNLEKARFVYGGSTITQQLVKNLYLTREKTLSRKLEELVISWQLERTLTKEEILLMYVNIVEFGPNIYGIRNASHHYFGKPPSEISPAEAAFIMGLKPYPKAGYRQWEKQRLKSWWVQRVKKVLEMLYKRERAISHEELLAAAPYQVRFRRPGESLWGGTPYVSPARARRSDRDNRRDEPVQDPNAVTDDLLILP